MRFDISAFTHKGTKRENNQDCILANGVVLNSGTIKFESQDTLCCFVADGVGGNNAGDFASDYILQKIVIELADIIKTPLETLKRINTNLIETTAADPAKRGAASTLSGLIVDKDFFKVIHAGDSELWLLRFDSFMKITNDQVLNTKHENSPITSYFGGKEDCLKLDEGIVLEDSIEGDLFVICSDGLFKTMSEDQLKEILLQNMSLKIKTEKILELCLLQGADDNVSVVLILNKS